MKVENIMAWMMAIPLYLAIVTIFHVRDYLIGAS